MEVTGLSPLKSVSCEWCSQVASRRNKITAAQSSVLLNSEAELAFEKWGTAQP